MSNNKFIKTRTGDNTPDYATGTTIFVKKVDEGAGVGKGYTVEIYNNGTKVDTMHKDTRSETLDVIKQYKQQYNTNRSFQNEIEVFVTYPEKDTVYEDNKAENDKTEIKEENKSEASMNIQQIDDILMKQAGHIEMLLYKITNPESPVKIRIAEEMPMPNDNINASSESIAKEIFDKFVGFIKKIVDSPADDSSKKNDLYNKSKGWLFKVNDTLKKYMDTNQEVTPEAIKENLNKMMNEFLKDPNNAKYKEYAENLLSKSPGNLEGKNQLNTPQENPQEVTAQLSADFWKFASTLAGEVNIEDVFNYYTKENKIEDRKAFWTVIEKDIETAFSEVM